MRCRFLVPVAVLGAVAVLVGCASGEPAQPVYFQDLRPQPPALRFLMARDLPMARATVNGQDVGFFLLDTGASTSVLDGAVAARLGLKPHRSMAVTGVGGSAVVPQARVRELAITGVSFPAQDVALVDLAPFYRNVRFPVAGILGYPNLAQGVFTLDYRAGLITLHPREGFVPPPGAQALDLRMVGGLPATRGVLAGAAGEPAVEAWLQIDTGSNAGLSLPLATLRRHPGLLRDQVNVFGQAEGVGGTATTVNSTLPRLRAFGRDLSEVRLSVETAAPEPPSPGGLPVGRLGNQVLKQVTLTFDAAGGRLWVHP